MGIRIAVRTLVILAAIATGSEAAAAKKAVVLLVPRDNGAWGPAVKFTEYLESSVERNSAYRLQPNGRIFGDPTPAEALTLRRKLQSRMVEGKKLFKEGSFDDAEAIFREVLKGTDAAAAAFERCSEYCDALAHLASTQLMTGEEEAARETLVALLTIDSNFRFEGPGFGQNFQILLRDVRRTMSREGLLGAINVQSMPAGAKVFLNGEFKGYTPILLERVPVGRHLLRMERPGAITYGQLVEVNAAEEGMAKVRLQPTPEYEAIQEAFNKIAADVERGSAGETSKLGMRLKVERGLVGTVRTSGSYDDSVVLKMMLVDFTSGKRLATRSRTFQGDEYGQLELEVRRFGNLLMSEGEKRSETTASKRRSSDPLDSRTGMEDWDEDTEDVGSRRQYRGDPLDSATGTSDW